jgi:hypothetical protein
MVTSPDRRYLLVLLAHIEPSARCLFAAAALERSGLGAAGHNVTSCQCTVVESTVSTAGPGALPEASRYLLWSSSSAMRSIRREASTLVTCTYELQRRKQQAAPDCVQLERVGPGGGD